MADLAKLERRSVRGSAIAVRGNDIDTDRIIPARFLRCVTFDGLGEHAFEDDRAGIRAQGGDVVHPFDDSRFEDASVLLVNKNFGCGSSREHAPQALMRWGKGIRAVVGESFAEIFFGNCTALGIPCVSVGEAEIEALMSAAEADTKQSFEVDLEKLEVRSSIGVTPCNMPAGVRKALLEGRWDTTADLLAALPEVKQRAAKLPYLNWDAP